MTRHVRRPPGLGDSEDGGFTLVELLVVMLLGSILTAVVGTVFTGALRTSKTARARTNLTADTTIALEVISRRLRVAMIPSGQTTAFVAASSSTITFYANLAGVTAPTLVTYSIDVPARCLRETSTPPDVSGPTPTWPAAGARSRCLAYGTVATTPPLLTYYASGTTATPVALDGTGAVPPAGLPNIRSIGIALSLGDADGSGAPPVRSVDRLTLTNLGSF